MTAYQTDRAFALEMDSKDPLANYREKFYIPPGKHGQDCIYFCGNSLGLQPKKAQVDIEQVLQDWARLGVEGHFIAKNPWLTYHESLHKQTAHLIGAKPIEVVVMNALTVNLHLMLISFYRPTPTKHKIVMEAGAFPSDQYAVKSQIKFHGFNPHTSLLELVPRPGEATIRTEDIEAQIERDGDSIALILLGGINYYTGQAFELDKITRAGHQKGCIVGFDLAHAVGNVILKLHNWNVDFAVWCSYKYLNAGPGSLAGCFVHERFANGHDLPRLAGWWGQNKETRFLMAPDFKPTAGAAGWQVSNPPILAMAPLCASMAIFDEVGMESLRAKSELLTGYLEFLIHQYLNDKIEIITPAEAEQRGCQLSLRVKGNGKSLYEKVKANDIICDWRAPDVIRVAPVPLYNRFMEVYNFVEILQVESQNIINSNK
ncbi:MAG: kynureninase [bacterium]